MSYFRELPDLEYQSFLSDSISSGSYLTVKNLFRRNKIRDDLKGVFTLLEKYEIKEGARPDTVAEEFYGKSDLDWVVLMTAGIINVRNEWPLSNKHLYDFAEEKYGALLNDVHHYETKEVKDSNGRLILPKEQIVDSNFSIPDPSDYAAAFLNPVRAVTNWEYEIRENEKKSSISILRGEYLQQFLNDMRQIMIYDQSSQRVDNKLARTENTRVTIPE